MIYLDNSATTLAAPSVIKAVADYMATADFNPSSIHAGGVAAASELERRRKYLSHFISPSSKPYNIIFTSSGTEANNLALLGFAQRIRKPATFLISCAEHSSILNAVKQLEERGVTVKMIPLSPDGFVDLEFIMGNIRTASLISVTQVASEIGSVQPIEAVVKLRDELAPACVIHSDGSQGFMRVAREIPKGLDMYTVSGHKIHAPKGVAALAVSRGVALAPIMFGGGQEGGLRAGTENMPGIVGLCEAVGLPIWKESAATEAMRFNKLRLYDAISAAIPLMHVNGPPARSLGAAPNILNLSLPDTASVSGEALTRALAERRVFIGTGSACASRQTKHKAIYKAMGITLERQKRAVRLSLSPFTTADECEEAAKIFIEVYRSVAM